MGNGRGGKGGDGKMERKARANITTSFSFY